MKCIYCDGESLQKRGKRNGRIRYQCNSCHRWPTYSIDAGELYVPVKQVPKILFFDIETLPLEIMTFKIYDQYVSHEQILRDWCIASWAAKWKGENQMHSDVLTQTEAVIKDDYRIVRSLWDLLNDADIVVYHNGDSFDAKIFRARLLKYHIPNPRYSKSIDTKKIAKSQFRLVCNKLDYLLMYLGHAGKIETDIDLWKRCLAGDPDALREMDVYCQGDVWKLEEVYMDLLPYITNHPDVGLWTEKDCCPNCGCESYAVDGTYPGTTYLYDAYRCGSCNALWHSRKKRKETRN